MHKLIITTLFIITLAFGVSSCQKKETGSSSQIIRIGYQKFGPLVYLKESQILEKELAAQHIEIKWKEFISGPPMLEALNTGGIDFANTGETPPIFAQSGGSKIIYVAYEAPSPKAEAVLVNKTSNIKQLSDLKGKKVGVAKGSSAHYTLLAVLQRAGLSFDDIQPYYLQPPEARTAFEGNNIDAWVIWEPFRSGSELQLEAITLVDTTGLKPNNQFYLASERFVSDEPKLLIKILETIKRVDQEINSNPQILVEPIAKLTRLPNDVVVKSVSNYNYELNYIDEDILNQQQIIADEFFKAKLIPNKINVKEQVWLPSDKVEKQ